MPHRTVFFISDGTGITAETFGNAILAQFEMKTRHIRLPFVDSADKAHQLGQAFANHLGALRLQTGGYADLAGERFDVVINATSTGLGQDALPLPDGVFAPGTLAYEMVYGKGLTPFLRQAQAAGVQRLADGVGMLVEQAAEAFVWWRGVRPDTAAVIRALTVPLL